MNTPSGFTLDKQGTILEVDPVSVIFNDAMPLMAAHMLVAAYVVADSGGLGVRLRHVARTARPVSPIGFHHRVLRRGGGDPAADGGRRLARALGVQQPAGEVRGDRIGSDDRQRCPGDPPRSSQRGRNRIGRHPDTVSPRLPDPSTGTKTVVQGLDTVPEHQRPTTSEVNTVHLAWDVMVGLGTLLMLLALWYFASWIFRRDMPKGRWFLRIATCAGVLAILAMEAGWVVSEVGRQPWIVYEYMKVEDAATGNTGVWITFVVVVLYIGVGATTILVLRGMSRRFRQGGTTDEDVPYGPRTTPASTVGKGIREHGSGGRALHRRPCVRDLRRRRFRCRSLGSPRRRDRPRSRPRTVIDHAIAPVWEANHVWLIFSFVVLWTCFPEAYASITLTLFVPLTIAALGIVLRGSSFAFRKAVLRTSYRRDFGAIFAVSSLLVPYCMGAVVGGIASGRVPAGGRQATRGTVGSTRHPSSAEAWPWSSPPTSPPSS